jgi:integrase
MELTKSTVANLYRAKSGTYFLGARIAGKFLRVSLETKSFAIARSKLPKEYERQIVVRQRRAQFVGCGSTMASVAARWRRAGGRSEEIKPRTKQYHKECLRMVTKVWQGWRKFLAADITEKHCLEWAEDHRRIYSATRYNGCVDAMRAIFEIAIKRGLRADNPMRHVPKATVKPKLLDLPSQEKFQLILKFLDADKKRHPAADTVRFMAYSGMRLNEAGQVIPAMVGKDQFNLPANIVKGQKHARSVPILAEMRPLLDRLLADYRASNRRGPLLPCRDPSKSLETCCKLAGTSIITNHDLRHLFATRCLEAGVDVKTVASWLGHVDGGALLLKTYAHLRNEHSQRMAALVKFGV